MASTSDVGNDISIDDLQINPQFRNLCPALSDERLSGLTADIISDNRFTDPILAWRSPSGDLFVADGHNRLDIWRNGNLPASIQPPRVELIELGDEDAVFLWIYHHQKNRRNWTPEQESYARGLRYQREKNPSAGRPKSVAQKTETPKKQGSNNVATVATLNRTEDHVAAETGVSPRTVRSDDKYATALDRIGEVNAKAKSDILNGTLSVSKKDVVAIGQQSDADIGNWLRDIRNGRKPDKPSASIVKDAVGRDVPAHLSDEHGAAAAINSAANKLDAIKREVTKLAGETGGQFIPDSEIKQVFQQLKGLISQARYWSECPKCCGKVESSCKRCDGHGFIPFKHRGALSSEESEWLGV